MSIASSPDRPSWMEQPVEQHVAGRELVRFLSSRVNEVTCRWQHELETGHQTRFGRVFPGEGPRAHIPLVVWWIIRSISEDDAPCDGCADALRRVAHQWRAARHPLEDVLLRFRILSRLLHEEMRSAMAMLRVPVDADVAARISERLSHGIMLAQVVLVAAYRDEEEARFATFGSMLAHEIRSPLSAAVAALQTLEFADEQRRSEGNDVQRASLRRVERALWDVNAIVGAVQSLTRAPASDGTSEKRGPLAGIIDRVLEELCAECGAVDVAREGSIPDVLVPEAPVLLALQNLVRNAIAYADRDKPACWVRVACERDEDRRRWLVRVKDNGIGIPEAEQKLVFQRFRRGIGAPGTGFGLGLSIVEASARCMGGDILVESQPGEGSTFTLTVPFHQTQTLLGRS